MTRAIMFAATLVLDRRRGSPPLADASAVVVVRHVGDSRSAGLACVVGVATEAVGARFGPAVDRRPAVDARQPARAVHRALRALGRRSRGRADVDARLALRERAARARPRDHRGLAAATTGSCASAHGCRTTRRRSAARRVHHRAARALGPGRRPRERAPVAISAVGAVALLAVYAVWLWGYLRSGGPQSRRSSSRRRGSAASASRSALLAVAGVGAAFVSDWFVDALDPAVEALGISRRSPGS